MDIQKLKSFRLTHFEFYDNNKHGACPYMIAFRVYTQTGEKSPCFGYDAWAKNPEGYN